MGQVIFSGDLGPCQVEWNGANVGPTVGGVKFKIELKAAEVKEDGQGNMPVDAVVTGYEIPDIEIPLTRFSLTQLSTMIKSSSLVGSILDLTNPVGSALYTDAKTLVLKPLVNNVASATTTQWVTFFKTYPLIKGEIGYDNANQRVYKVGFKVFVKQESPNINEVAKFGA